MFSMKLDVKKNPEKPKVKPSYGMLGKKGTNQYIKAKELGIEQPKYTMTEETRNKISEANKKRFSDPEERKKQSERMKKAVAENPDSYTKNNVCGRVKIIEHNGAKLKGQWELATAKWFDRQSIGWENEPKGFSYIWNEKEHTYYPDFYLKEYNVYIEVKGYKTDRDEAKWSHFPERLIVIDSKLIYNLDEMTIEDLLCR